MEKRRVLSHEHFVSIRVYQLHIAFFSGLTGANASFALSLGLALPGPSWFLLLAGYKLLG